MIQTLPYVKKQKWTGLIPKHMLQIFNYVPSDKQAHNGFELLAALRHIVDKSGKDQKELTMDFESFNRAFESLLVKSPQLAFVAISLWKASELMGQSISMH